MPDALVKPEARERERERASGGAGEGETKRGGSGRDDFLQTLHPPLSYSHSPTPPLPRSHALSLSRSLHLPLSRSPLLSAPIMFALFVSFLSLPIFVSFFVIVVFDGADERAAYGRGHS